MQATSTALPGTDDCIEWKKTYWTICIWSWNFKLWFKKACTHTEFFRKAGSTSASLSLQISALCRFVWTIVSNALDLAWKNYNQIYALDQIEAGTGRGLALTALVAYWPVWATSSCQQQQLLYRDCGVTCEWVNLHPKSPRTGSKKTPVLFCCIIWQRLCIILLNNSKTSA